MIFAGQRKFSSKMEKTLHYEKYYTVIEALASIFDRKYRSCGFHGPYNQSSFEKWQVFARHRLYGDLGLDVLDEYLKCSNITDSTEWTEEEYGIQKEKVLLFVSQWGVIPIYILKPINPKGVFLCFAGHHSTGKLMTSGTMICSVTKSMTDKYGADYGIELAKRGYIAVCPDSVGFGERREISAQGDSAEQFQSSSCLELSKIAISLGFSLAGMMVYEGRCLIQYIEKYYGKQMPIHVIGFSGGGMQSLYLSAIDERIKGTIISGYFYGFKDSLLYMNSNCSCNYIPGIFRDFDMCDLAGLIAPRNLVIQSAKNDHLNGRTGIENVVSQINEVKKIYSIYGKTVLHDIKEGGHVFHKESLDVFLNYI